MALHLFGFVINLPKSITRPTQQMEFLDFFIDTVTMTIAFPPHKMEAIQKETSHLLESGTRALAYFIGTLVVIKPAVPLVLGLAGPEGSGPPVLSDIRPDLDTTVSEAKTDLQWWKTQLFTHHSTPILKPEATIPH